MCIIQDLGRHMRVQSLFIIWKHHKYLKMKEARQEVDYDRKKSASY